MMNFHAIRFLIKHLIIISGFIFLLFSCSNKKEISSNHKEINYTFGKLKWQGEWIEKDTTNLKYPCTLDSAILVFFNTWDDSTTLKFKEIPDSNLAMINHSFGMWLRNSYGLWYRTCLVDYFWDKGIFHPDDISAILLTSHHRYLNAIPINLDEQVSMYKLFWKDEMGIEYKIEDSASWEFPPSMWDFGITSYQEDPKKQKAVEILKKSGIKLRDIKSHNGFTVHYNCDSIPFLKKLAGDTIKIWTESNNTAIEIQDFELVRKDKNFSKTIYVKDIFNDGRILVARMHETVLISRRDSLYEVYNKKPKLIFHPKMFSQGNKIKLSSKVNFMRDEIFLQKEWIENGKKCYTVRINNNETSIQTSYAYSFDENLRFIYWEDCNQVVN